MAWTAKSLWLACAVLVSQSSVQCDTGVHSLARLNRPLPTNILDPWLRLPLVLNQRMCTVTGVGGNLNELFLCIDKNSSGAISFIEFAKFAKNHNWGKQKKRVTRQLSFTTKRQLDEALSNSPKATTAFHEAFR